MDYRAESKMKNVERGKRDEGVMGREGKKEGLFAPQRYFLQQR